MKNIKSQFKYAYHTCIITYTAIILATFACPTVTKPAVAGDYLAAWTSRLVSKTLGFEASGIVKKELVEPGEPASYQQEVTIKSTRLTIDIVARELFTLALGALGEIKTRSRSKRGST